MWVDKVFCSIVRVWGVVPTIVQRLNRSILIIICERKFLLTLSTPSKKKEWVLSKKVASEKKVLIYSSPSLDTEWHLHFKSITIHNVCFEFLYCWRITFIHIMTFIEKFIWVRVFNVADLNLITIVLPNFIHVISSFFFQISIHDSKMT